MHLLSTLIAFTGATTTLVAAAPIQGVRRFAAKSGEIVIANEEIIIHHGGDAPMQFPSASTRYRFKRAEMKKPPKPKKKKPKSKKKNSKPKKKDPEESGDDDPDSGDIDESGEDDKTDESGRNDIDDDTNSGDTNSGDTDGPDDETDSDDDGGKHRSGKPKAKGRKKLERWTEKSGWDNIWTSSHDNFKSKFFKKREIVFDDDKGNDGDDEGEPDKE